jgi:hypothetical protein
MDSGVIIAGCVICIFIVIPIFIVILHKNRSKSRFTNIFSNFAGLFDNENYNKQYDNNKSYSGITNNSDTPWTINRNTKDLVQDILRKILNIINTRTQMSYYLMSFDQLKQDKLNDGVSVRYVADFFVHEMRDLHTRRMIIIFTVNFSTKEVDVNHVNLSNAFKNPNKDFMNLPDASLILQDNNLLANEYHIMGLNTSKLEHSVLNENKMSPKQVPTPTEFQKWILPMGIASAYQNPQAMFPNRRQSNCWDTAGVNYIEAETPYKWGVKNTPLTRYPYPYINPTVNRQRDADDGYNWLFDLVQNTSGISSVGVAVSP